MDPPPETAQGRALFEELLWVHGAIRRDLATCERLAAEVLSGLRAEEARERIESLRTNGPLWQLKVNCLRYCRFVHSHHNAEDALFFPTLRAANPAVGTVIDRLEAEHRSVSDLLDAVEAAADALDGEEESARIRLAEGLTNLAEQLLAHLDYEEREAGPTIRSLERHPFLTPPLKPARGRAGAAGPPGSMPGMPTSSRRRGRGVMPDPLHHRARAPVAALVNETISARGDPLEAELERGTAASVAYPCPQADRASRQPTSTAGVSEHRTRAPPARRSR